MPTGTEASDSTILQQCFQKCQYELEWDEHFYYFAKIKIHSKTSSIKSDGRPDGCVFVYDRLLNEYDIAVPDEKIRPEWLRKTAPHYIQRVDPVPGTNGKTWKALCYNPCQSNDDCAPKAQNGISRKAYTCALGACQKNRNESDSYWLTEQRFKDMVIVTGADSGYFMGLQNLVASARYWLPRNRVVIYNLGFSKEQLSEAGSWWNVVEIRWKDGFPEHFPEHARVGKKYAWKPIAIKEALDEYKMIFWMDAGSTFTGPIDAMERIVEQTGIFLVKGQDMSMMPMAHPATFRWFNFTKETFVTSGGGPHYSGNTQAFLAPSRYYDTIIKSSADCAMDEMCIAPPGSNLDNHRYDQTVLSILSYNLEVQVPHHTEYLAASQMQVPNLFNQENPNFMFVWTARQGCREYFNHEQVLKKQQVENKSLFDQ
jgi:hypothetical protein